MPAPFSKAQLHTEINAVIRAQIAPESITPTTLSQVLDDIVDSFWNLIDNPGLSGAGGIQGLPGEFLANITSDTRQTLLIDENVTTGGGLVTFAKLKLPNDADNGSFDNGNNWLVDKYTTPISGFAAIAFLASGVIMTLLQNNITGTGQRQIRISITQNGTAIASTAVQSINPADPVDVNYYFEDIAQVGIVAAPGDIFALEVYTQRADSQVADVLVQFQNGFFNNEL